ncbi:MAG: hypothetical protein AAF307_13105, partial [Pseudomonadota bacterium]
GEGRGGDLIFPALFVITAQVKEDAPFSKLPAFGGAIFEALLAASKTETDRDEPEEETIVSRVSVHDVLHAYDTIRIASDEASEPKTCELIVFLEQGVDQTDFAALLKAALERYLEDDQIDIKVARTGPTIQSTSPAAYDVQGFFEKFSKDRVDQEAEAKKSARKRKKTNAPQTITAVIDHAIGFANSRFCKSGKTRFMGFWAQQVDPASLNGSADEEAAAGLQNATGIGLAKSRSEIQALLDMLGTTELPDEASLYRKAGLSDRPVQPAARGVDPLRLTVGHGTQVLDLAAGDDPYVDGDFPASSHAILAVQLPPELVSRTNGYLTELFVKSALNWIWMQAKLLIPCADNTVIVNLSFSSHCGRQDGQGLMEADLERRLERGEIALATLPAGNSYQSQSHVVFDERDLSQDWQEIEFAVQPDGKAPVFVQVYCDGVANDGDTLPIRVMLEGPNGTPSAGAATAEGYYEQTEDGQAQIYYQTDRPRYLLPLGETAAPRTMITIAINPTDLLFHPMVPQAAAPGLWRLRIRGTATLSRNAQVDAWIERGESLSGFPRRGKQAYFVHENYRRFRADGRINETDEGDTPLRRSGTLNGLASAPGPLAIASIRRSDGYASYFSSARGLRGPINGQPRYGAFAQKSNARPNVLASGILSSGVTFASGTSFASAIVARFAAIAAANPSGGAIEAQLDAQLEDPPIKSAIRYGKGTLVASREIGKERMR